jgi:hypothetical protein
MGKSPTAFAICVIAFAFSASSFSYAMPAPTPGDIELSAGLAQWGAETEALDAMSDSQMAAALRELARQLPAAKTKAAMCKTLAAAAQAHDLPVGFFVRLINQESGFNPSEVSSAGAQGVAQFMPKVAEEWGLKNPFDPHAALMASARFLRSLYEQFGNWGLAAAAYNGGSGRVQKWVDKRGKLPDETRHYVMTITGVPAEKWIDGKSKQAKFSIPARAPCQEIAYLADPRVDVVPTPPSPTPASRPVAGPASKTTNIVAIPFRAIPIKSGMKMAVIQVKSASKVAAKIAAPPSLVAAALPHGKRGKAATAVKVAEKSTSKSHAKAKDSKKAAGKGRLQVADARAARK